MSNSLRALIFDFDGTIAETERLGHRVAYNRAFAELKLPWYWNEQLYGKLLAVTGGRERLRFYIDHYQPVLPTAMDVAKLVADIHQAKIRHFAATAAAIPFRPGVQRLVYEAYLQGVRIAIATTASKRGVEALIAQDSAFAKMIDVIAANETVERKKPAPDVYLWVLQRLGCNASECVAIEDSNVGLRAAVAASIPAIITASDYTAEDDFGDAEAVLSSLGDDDVAARSIAGLRPTANIVDVSFLRALQRQAFEARRLRASLLVRD